MSIYRLSIRPRRLLAVVVVVALLALMATAFVGPGPGPARAVGPAAGMGLQIKSACTDASQLTTVNAGVPFVVCVVSNLAPSVAIAGLTSEVLFPPELKWLPRVLCTDEVQVETLIGMAPPEACQAGVTLLGGVGHVVLSEVTIPPFAALDVATGSTTTLIELDFTCNEAGSHKLTLTAVPDSAFGAVYVDVNNSQINVKTVQQDYDADTSANDVADTLVVACVEESVGGIAELPDVAGTLLETTASSNGNLGLVVGAATAMLLAFSGAAWYVSKRRFG